MFSCSLQQINYFVTNKRSSSWWCNGEYFNVDVYRQYYIGVNICTIVTSVYFLYSSGNENLVLQFYLKTLRFLTISEKMLTKNIMFWVLLEVGFLVKKVILQCYSLKIVQLNRRYVMWVVGACSSRNTCLSFWFQQNSHKILGLELELYENIGYSHSQTKYSIKLLLC